jgi:hypothetical protein
MGIKVCCFPPAQPCDLPRTPTTAGGSQTLIEDVRLATQARLVDSRAWDARQRKVVPVAAGNEDVVWIRSEMRYTGQPTHPLREHEVPAFFVNRVMVCAPSLWQCRVMQKP